MTLDATRTAGGSGLHTKPKSEEILGDHQQFGKTPEKLIGESAFISTGVAPILVSSVLNHITTYISVLDKLPLLRDRFGRHVV
jgi:hypothetical protein